MSGLLTSSAPCASLKRGLLSTTALALLITLSVPNRVSADDLIYNEQPSDNEWDFTGQDWNNTTTSTNPDRFDDGDDVTFDNFSNTITVRRDVRPGSILFTATGGGLNTITTANDSGIFTGSGSGGILAIDRDEAGGTLNINIDIGGSNDVIFNSRAAAPGIINMDGDIATGVGLSGGELNILAASAISGNTVVTGGTLNNAGDTAVGGGLLSSVTISGVSAGQQGRLFNQTDANISGNTTVNVFGQITNGAQIGSLNIVGGSATNQNAGTVTGGTTVSGGLDGATPVTGILNANGGSFTTINVRDGGVTNVNDETDGDVTVNGGRVVVSSAGVLNDLIIVNEGLVTNGGSLAGGATVNGTSVTEFGQINNQSTRSIGGTLTVNDFGVVNNAGTIADLTLTGGVVDNQGTGDITGSVDVRGGELITTGTVSGDARVRAGGVVTANGGSFTTLDIQNNGIMNVNAATGGVVTVSSGTVNVRQAGVGPLPGVQGSLTDTAIVNEGTLNNAGLLANGVTVNGTGGAVGQLDNQSNGVINGVTRVTGAGDVNNANIIADLDLQGGSFDNQSTGEIRGSVTMSGGVLNNFGDIGTLAGSGPVDVTGGVLTNSTGGTILGPVTAGSNTTAGLLGTLNAEGGSFSTVDVQNGGQFNMSAVTDVDLTVSGGNALISNQLQGTLAVTNGTANVRDANAGDGTPRASVTGLASVSGGTLFNAGDLLAGASVTGATGTLNNQSTGVIAGTTTLTAGVANNAGDVAALNVQGGSFVNQSTGEITGAVSVTDGQLSNNTGGVIAQTVDLSADGTVNINGGTFGGGINATGGTLNINTDYTAALVNNGTTIRINGTVDDGFGTQVDPVAGQNGALIGPGTIDNQSGTIETFAGARIAGLVTLRAGRLTSDGGNFEGGVNVQGGIAAITDDTTMAGLTNTGGLVQNDSGAILSSDVTTSGTGTTTNAGRIAGLVSAAGGGTYTQSGAGATTRDLVTSAAGGNVIASGGTFESGITATGGDVLINGTVTAGTVTNAGGGEITIAATTGNMTGNLISNAGTFRVNGTLTGNLDVNNGSTGVVLGAVTAGATVDGGSTLITRGIGSIAGTTTVTGATLLAEGSNFTGAGAVLNTGAVMQVRGTVGGTITNTDGAITVDTDGDFTGTLTQNGGSTDVSGVISGTANIDGGTMTTQSGSAFATAVDVDGGALTVNGGTFAGGIDARAGGVDVVGTATGDIRTAGATVDIATTGRVNGDVTQTSGATTNNGIIDGALNVQGATVTQAAGTVTGLTTVSNAGVLVASGGSLSGGLNISGGTTQITGDVSIASLTNTGGIVAISGAGSLNSTLTHNSGTTEVAGLIADLVVNAAGLDVTTGATVSGTTTVNTNGELSMAGGVFEELVTNAGGRIDVDADSVGSVTNNAGLLVVQAGNTLTGNITNADNFLLNGTVTGRVNNTDGTLTVASGQDATVANGLDNASGATVALAGTLRADVTNAVGGIFDVNGGTLIGGFDNFGDMTTTGTSRASEASTNAGTLTVESGSLTINDTFENSAGNTLNINAGTTFEAVTTTNTATGLIINNGTLVGALNNAGVLDTTSGTFSGLTTNTGEITGDDIGTLTFSGGLRNDGSIDLSGNETVGDVLTVGGAGLSGSGTFVLDLDLSNDVGGLGDADYIIAEAGAAVTGNINLSFNVLGVGGEQLNEITVIDVDEGAANNFTYTSTGLPDPGESIIYALTQNGDNGDVFVSDLLNPGVGALAGSIVLTQSLIGSVINRPSSPFVNGLAYEDEDPCGAGGWARFTGGSADSSGIITQEGENARALRGEISADFYGLQLGGDFTCSNGYFNGWDLAAGAIGGFNEGQSSQPVFALDAATGGLSDRVTSITDVDFRQGYLGVYGTAVRDRLGVELQYRLETTAFTANNVGQGGSAGLGLDDSQFDSDSSTFSGSASYLLNIPNTEMTFAPVVGFAYTQVSSDPIIFENGSVVQVEDFTSQVGFVGGTVTRTSFGEDGTTALNQFVTATYYNDFADDPRSTFTDAGTGDVRSITTENLGDYTEISAGLSYVKILDIGNGLNAKQLSASVRGDWRVSDQLESWGVTAQMRLQF